MFNTVLNFLTLKYSPIQLLLLKCTLHLALYNLYKLLLNYKCIKFVIVIKNDKMIKNQYLEFYINYIIKFNDKCVPVLKKYVLTETQFSFEIILFNHKLNLN